MHDTGIGILAIWHNCRAGDEATFEHWYQSEHLIERVSVPGFRSGRRFEGLDGFRQYFTYYVGDTPEVFTSKAYTDRLNDPTPLTQEIMNGIFQAPSRTVCARRLRMGVIDGAIAVTAVTTDPDLAARWVKLDAAALPPVVASCEVWTEVAGASNVGSQEQKMRGGDETIAGCLFVTVLRERDGNAVVAWMERNGAGRGGIGVFRQLCELRSESLENAG